MRIKYLFLILIFIFYNFHWVFSQCTSSFNQPSNPCEGNNLSFSNTSSGSNLIYLWDFGDGNNSQLKNPSHVYLSSSTYTVGLTITDTISQCTDYISKILNVLPSPAVPQLFDGNGTPNTSPEWKICKYPSDPDSFRVDFSSPGSMGNYSIAFGDGTSKTGTSWNAGSVISHNYISLGVFNVVLTLTGVNACKTTITGRVINLRNPTAGIIGPPPGQSAGCSPKIVRFINNSAGVDTSTQFVWDLGDGTKVNWKWSQSNDTLFHTYNSSNSGCGMVISLSAINQCKTTTTTWSPVDIFGPDQVNMIVSPNPVCGPNAQVSIINQTILNCLNGIRKYYIDFGDGTKLNWGSDPTPYTKTYLNPGTYQVMMIDSTSCGKDTSITSLVVTSPPIANLNALPKSVCIFNNVTFNNTSTGNASSYYWDFGDGTGQTTYDLNPITHQYSTSGTYKVILYAYGASSGCQDSASTMINVVSGPTPAISFSPKYSCNTAIVTFINNSSSANGYLWSFGNGNTSILKDPPVQNYNTDGIYPVSLTVSGVNGCSATIMDTVYVTPPPLADFKYLPACLGSPTAFFDSSTTAFGNIVKWNWDFGNGITDSIQNPIVLFNSAGIQSVSLNVTNNAGCSGSINKNIMVFPNPQAQFTISPDSGCGTLTSSFNNTSTGINLNYSWDLNNDGILDFFGISPSPKSYNNSSSRDTTIPIKLIVVSSDGCRDSLSQNIFISAPPSVAFTSSKVEGCGPLNVSFTNQSQPLSCNFVWLFGSDSAFTTNASYTFKPSILRDSIYLVSLVAVTPSGCRDTVNDYVRINAEPVADFVSTPDSVCLFQQIQLINQSLGAVSYNWDIDNGTINSKLVNPILMINKTGNINVELTVTSTLGCKSSKTGNFQVMPSPTASFTYVKVCSGDTVKFSDASNISSGGNLSWLWDFGNGLNSQMSNPKVLFAKPDTQQVQLIVTSEHGCKDTVSLQVLMNPKPQADFSLFPTGNCGQISNTFNNNSTGTIQTYLWDLDSDGVDDYNGINPVQKVYNNTSPYDSIYHIRLTCISPSGCIDTSVHDLLVPAYPVAVFTSDSIIGCGPMNVNFKNTSIPVNCTYKWNFGGLDSSILANPSYQFPKSLINAKDYQVQLIVSSQSACRDTFVQLISVQPEPLVSFSSTPDSGCSPLNVQMLNNSLGATSYAWSVENGLMTSLLVNPSFTFTNTTTSDSSVHITLIATSAYGCASPVLSHQVLVHPGAKASFSPTNAILYWPASSLTFTNTSNNGPWNYNWNYGDGSQEILPFTDPSHNYSNWGTFPVQLNMSSYTGCNDSASGTVTIIAPQPQPSFTISPSTACHGIMIQFVNTSMYGDSFQWSFGDGSFSTLKNPPPHYYAVKGKYTISLKASNPNGDSTITMKDTVTIYESPLAALSCKPDTVFVPDQELNCINLTDYVVSWEWNFGDGFISGDSLVSHSYKEVGTYPLMLVVTNQYGCRDTIHKKIVAVNGGEIYVPNAFTPDSDGYNEYFNAIGVGIKEFNMQIYNRWGDLLYETHEYGEGWNGKFGGKNCKQDVYIYKIWGMLSNSKKYDKIGYVALIK